MQNWTHHMQTSNRHNGTTTTIMQRQQKQNSSAQNNNNNNNEEEKPIMSFFSKRKNAAKGSVAMDEMQSLLVSKLNVLSLEERDSGLHDLHGVADKAEEESLEMLQAKIQEMDRILDTDDSSSEDYDDDNDVEYDLTDLDTFTTFKVVKGHEKNMKEYSYKKAKMINQEYYDEMKVTCLRATSYDVEKAAQLLIRFFHRKLQLFGLTCLGREITQQDLIDYNPDAEVLLRKGMAGLLPYRDRAGRAIIFLDGHVNGECMSTDLVLRVVFYMCLVSLRDLETQREGVVVTYYGVDQDRKHAGRSLELWNNWNATPFRNVAFHMCMANNNIHLHGLTIIFNRFQSHKAVRARLHTGSHMECVYNLLTFGIPKDAIPVSTDGSRDWTSHHNMLDTIRRREDYLYSNNKNRIVNNNNERSSKSLSLLSSQQYPSIRTVSDTEDTEETAESSTSSSSLQQDNTNVAPFIEDASSLMMMPLPTEEPFDDDNNNTGGDHSQEEEVEVVEEVEELVLVPNPKDILLGKGRLPKSHQGNLRFHNLLQDNREVYDSSLKREKTAVSQRLLQQLKTNGCRFLSPDKNRGGYTVVNDQVAREKISHGFRNLRILEERNKGLSSSSSTTKTTKKKTTTKKTKSPPVLDTTTPTTYDEDSGCSDISERSQFGRNKKQKNFDQ